MSGYRLNQLAIGMSTLMVHHHFTSLQSCTQILPRVHSADRVSDLTSVDPSMRLGLQQGLACLLTACFRFEANCPLPPLHSVHVTYPKNALDMLHM